MVDVISDVPWVCFSSGLHLHLNIVQICELDPGFFRECDVMVRNLQGRLEILAMSVHFEGDTSVDDYDDHEDVQPSLPKESTDSVAQLSEKLQKQAVSTEKNTEEEVKQHKCNTCNVFVGDAKQYRDHFKSEWHRHNLKRKSKQLPPLTKEECLADVDLDDSRADLKDYSFWGGTEVNLIIVCRLASPYTFLSMFYAVIN